MKKVDQIITHDPENGVYGDCQRACIASLLELDINEVPHFHESGKEDDFHRSLNQFLGERGLVCIAFKFGSGLVFEDLVSLPDPIDCYHMIYGYSSRGVFHAVVGLNGEVVHDPHPAKEGLLESDKENWDYAFLVKSQ